MASVLIEPDWPVGRQRAPGAPERLADPCLERRERRRRASLTEGRSMVSQRIAAAAASLPSCPRSLALFAPEYRIAV